jgi:hypothetical protein
MSLKHGTIQVASGGVKAMSTSRRDFLRGTGAGAFLWFAPRFQGVTRLERVMNQAIGSRNIGVAIARFVQEGDDLRDIYRFAVNGDDLRPTASCFKAWLPLYYFNFTPYEEWDDAERTPVYSATVHSNNVATGRLMQQVGALQNFGNDLEKYNDFLLYGMRLEHGISSWNWPGNPLVGVIDDRFSSGGERVVRAGGEVHNIGNVTTANDTLNGWREMLRRTITTTDVYTDSPYRRQAALRSLRLLSIPGIPEYNSPMERVLGRGVYIGKDGVLPADSISTGRVVNDAGLIPLDDGMMAVSFFSVGESEFSAIEILRDIVTAMYEAEATLPL